MSYLVIGATEGTEEEDEGVSSVSSWSVLDSTSGFHNGKIHCVACVVLQEALVDVDVNLLLLLFILRGLFRLPLSQLVDVLLISNDAA